MTGGCCGRRGWHADTWRSPSASAWQAEGWWLGGQQAGEITTLVTRGPDALDAYFARYLPASLLRFVTPAGGAITAGDADLARIPADDWLAQIAWVPQHPHLFATTVAGNIALRPV